jgi:hypothetical protein
MSEHEYTDLLERGIICAVHDHTDLMRDPLGKWWPRLCRDCYGAHISLRTIHTIHKDQLSAPRGVHREEGPGLSRTPVPYFLL